MPHADHLSDSELLRLVDGHLSPDGSAAAAAHADRCARCGPRRELFARLGAGAARVPIDERTRRGVAAARAGLQVRLVEEAERPVWPWAAAFRLARWSAVPAAVAVGALALFLGARPPEATNLRRDGAPVESDARPIAALTPGFVLDVPATELCARTPRPAQAIGEAVRLAVLRAYGMEHVPADQYELDYLITPELGGAPDARNLWPQRYRERVWNAGVKDQLEDLLPRLVCEGRLDLRAAQREIAHDWVGAYRKHFRTRAPLRAPAAVVGLIVHFDAGNR